MKRLTVHATIALGLGLTLALLWALDGMPTAKAAPAGTTRYVAPWGDDSGNLCTSPITPCRTVQQAVNLSWSGDDEVLVAAGVYTATSGQVLFIQSTVVIRGGYSTDFSAWDPQTYLTTLDGRGLMRVIYILGDITPTLEALRLTNGHVDGDGGGIYSVNAHPVISGCHVYLNTAINTNDGGGVYLENGHHAVLMGNEICSNTAGWNGGGVSLYGSDDVRLANNQIYHNITENGGGGVSYEDSDNATVASNLVLSNTAGWFGGGVYIANSSSATLVDNSVLSNTVTILGGGLYLGNCDSATLTSNQFYRNRATLGGAGISLNSGTTVTLTSNMVLENQIVGSGNGAGIMVAGSDAYLLHNTIARNSAGNGQGIYVGTGASAWLTNTILVGHAVGIDVVGPNAAARLSATLWGDGVWGNGMNWNCDNAVFSHGYDVTGYPHFVDPDGGDYHVTTDSAAVGEGLTTFVTTDIDGEPRRDPPTLGADEPYLFVYLPLALRDD
jgi:parallel beta-helix repeat protein